MQRIRAKRDIFILYIKPVLKYEFPNPILIQIIKCIFSFKFKILLSRTRPHYVNILFIYFLYK